MTGKTIDRVRAVFAKFMAYKFIRRGRARRDVEAMVVYEGRTFILFKNGKWTAVGTIAYYDVDQPSRRHGGGDAGEALAALALLGVVLPKDGERMRDRWRAKEEKRHRKSSIRRLRRDASRLGFRVV